VEKEPIEKKRKVEEEQEEDSDTGGSSCEWKIWCLIFLK
jgi:hypothetical protein